MKIKEMIQKFDKKKKIAFGAGIGFLVIGIGFGCYWHFFVEKDDLGRPVEKAPKFALGEISNDKSNTTEQVSVPTSEMKLNDEGFYSFADDFANYRLDKEKAPKGKIAYKLSMEAKKDILIKESVDPEITMLYSEGNIRRSVNMDKDNAISSEKWSEKGMIKSGAKMVMNFEADAMDAVSTLQVQGISGKVSYISVK